MILEVSFAVIHNKLSDSGQFKREIVVEIEPQ